MYNRKNLAISEDRNVPGSCQIIANLQTDWCPEHWPKYVGCLLAQFAPGKPQQFYKDIVHEHGFIDDASQRLAWFKESLNNLKLQMQPLEIKSIAFPKYIGCGLAGGDFYSYQKIIDEFICSLDDNIIVFIVSFQ